MAWLSGHLDSTAALLALLPSNSVFKDTSVVIRECNDHNLDGKACSSSTGGVTQKLLLASKGRQMLR